MRYGSPVWLLVSCPISAEVGVASDICVEFLGRDSNDVLQIRDGGPKSGEDGSTDDAVSDVEFLESWQGCDRGDIPYGEGMAGIKSHAVALDGDACFLDSCEGCLYCGVVHRALMVVEGVGIGAGMDFADVESASGGCLDLLGFGIDKGTHGKVMVSESTDGTFEGLKLAKYIQPTFSGDFFATLGDEHDHLGLGGQGDLDHGRGGSHLKIQRNLDGFDQPLKVIVLDMTSILSEVHRDAISPPELCFSGSFDGVGLPRSPGLAQRCHMIDVYTECSHFWDESFLCF